MLSALATSPMPLTASLKSHSRSGFSGLPKLRQFVNECGLAPTASLAASVRIYADREWVRGSSDGQSPEGILNGLQNSGIAVAPVSEFPLERLDDRVPTNFMIVLPDYPVPVAYVGRGQELDEFLVIPLLDLRDFLALPPLRSSDTARPAVDWSRPGNRASQISRG